MKSDGLKTDELKLSWTLRGDLNAATYLDLPPQPRRLPPGTIIEFAGAQFTVTEEHLEGKLLVGVSVTRLEENPDSKKK